MARMLSQRAELDAEPRARRIRWQAWLVLVTLTAVSTAISTRQSLTRYCEFRSGWSWDLAYYNQWYWALNYGDRTLTVRPIAAYAEEGPSIWKMNYLAPVRLMLAPLYRLYPDPRVLLLIQNVVFWWIIPAAYTLVRAESRSSAVALVATCLVPLTPFLWPLVTNDFRELQLAGPFILWAVQGIRGRSLSLAALGIAGMLACRHEYAVMVATFAFLPPRQSERLDVSLRWRHVILFVGLSWLFLGFFPYLYFVVGRNAPHDFVAQFLTPKASLRETLETSGQTLALGMGAWAILALFAPRCAIMAIPWIWGPCSGRWGMHFLSQAEWHHVRYLMPMTAAILAAGLIGFARLSDWILSSRRPWLCSTLVAISALAMNGAALRAIAGRTARAPVVIDRDEAQAIWGWIHQVDPDDSVIADYEVSAPLSSRTHLYSYILDSNRPLQFPRLSSDIHWLFIRNDYPFLNLLVGQGFDIVHRGKYLTIARRTPVALARIFDFFRFCANTRSG
jgi:Predicted membrane protein (DUF2079)